MPEIFTHDPGDVLRFLLIDIGQGTLPTAGGSWPVFHPEEMEYPDECITVRSTEGISSGSDSITNDQDMMFGFQVRLRSATPNGGYVKAGVLASAMDQVYRRTVTIGAKTYRVHSISRGTVLPIGKDSASNRNLYTINGTVSITPTN